jgi:hypothetical protein
VLLEVLGSWVVGDGFVGSGGRAGQCDEVAVQDEVAVYSYGRQWVLHDPTTGKTFNEIGTTWRQSRGLHPVDKRSLKEIGIEAGSRLMAVRVNG